jgi:Superinfection immunity protein/Short C-terminal domain
MIYYHHFFPFLPGALGLGVAIFLLFPYFLPTIIAIIRKHGSTGGIFALNFLLGWTVIGWVGSLIWALSADNRTTVIVERNPVSYSPPPPYNPPPSYTPTPRQTDPTIRPAAKTTQPDTAQAKIDQLRQLKQLLDEGALTEEEFNRQKAAILG